MTDWRPAEETEKQQMEEEHRYVETRELNLHQRLHRAMSAVTYVQKTKKKDMKYSIVTHDDVTAKVRPALHAARVHYRPVELKHGQDGNRTWAYVVVRFANIDNSTDHIDVPSFGYGIDSQDKGPGKAISYAVKYALLKTLGLETGDDPDMDQTVQHVSEQEQKEVERKAEQARLLAERKDRFDAAFEVHGDAVRTIANGIDEFWASGDYEKLKEAAAAWCPLPEDVQRDLWLAPTKGGELTTEQRAFMKTREFTDAYHGEREEAAA
jgi:hypothetical protein